MRAVVLLPTYNERENIAEMLGSICTEVPEVDVVVIDDQSPDGTGALADEFAASRDNVSVLHRGGKAGLAAAYREGFRLAADRGYDVIVSMDCDFSHDPAVIPRLLELVDDGADLAIGSRYVPGGGTVDWPLHRRLLSRWGNRYAGFMLRTDVRDCTSGFRAYRTSALMTVDPAGTAADGYAFLTELVRRLRSNAASIVETPILFRDRERGTSKMSGRIIVESMLLVTRWGLADRWAALRRRRST